jgi:hypothetical protein
VADGECSAVANKKSAKSLYELVAVKSRWPLVALAPAN